MKDTLMKSMYVNCYIYLEDRYSPIDRCIVHYCTSCVVTVTIFSDCQAVIKLMLNSLASLIYILTDDIL